MAVSVIYLDKHGKQVAERVSNITYKSEDISYRMKNDDYWIADPSDNNLLFECGSEKEKGYVKLDKFDNIAVFYVKIREFGSPRQTGENYPEKNTIYIAPEENELTEAEYYSLCYQQAEEKIRALAKFVSGGVDKFISIDNMADIRECLSNAFFVDAFTVKKPDFSYFEDAVNEAAARCRELLNESMGARALIQVQVPEDINLQEYDDAMTAISNLGIKSKVEIIFSDSGESSISITAAISCHHLKREEK